MLTTVDTENLEDIRVGVQSSLIEYLEYSKHDSTLSIKFKGGKHRGRVRSYEDVPAQSFFELLSQPSIGKAVLRLLKSRSSDYPQ